MKTAEKVKWLVLPSLLIIVLGMLEIKFPHALNSFDDNYTGRGTAGFIMLLFELFLMLTWGRIEGTVLVFLGLLLLTLCFLPEDQQFKKQISEISKTNSDQGKPFTSLSSFAVRTDKDYLERRLGNRQP